MSQLAEQFFNKYNHLSEITHNLGTFSTEGQRARPRGLSDWESEMGDAIVKIGDKEYTPAPHLQIGGYRNIAKAMKDSEYATRVNGKYVRDENGNIILNDPKGQQQKAINKAAEIMFNNLIKNGKENCAVKSDDLFVPMYNSHGKAGYTLKLADTLAEKLRSIGIEVNVLDVLTADERAPKSENNTAHDMDIFIDDVYIDDEFIEWADIYADKTIWLVDNTTTRGSTFNNLVSIFREKGITNRISPLSFTISNSAQIKYDPKLNADIIRRRDEKETKSSYILAKYDECSRRFVYIPFLKKTKNSDYYRDINVQSSNSTRYIKDTYIRIFNDKPYCLDEKAHSKFGFVAEEGKLDGTLDNISPSEDKEIPFIKWSPAIGFEDPADAIQKYYKDIKDKEEQRKNAEKNAEILRAEFALESAKKEKEKKRVHKAKEDALASLQGEHKEDFWKYDTYKNIFNKFLKGSDEIIDPADKYGWHTISMRQYYNSILAQNPGKQFEEIMNMWKGKKNLEQIVKTLDNAIKAGSSEYAKELRDHNVTTEKYIHGYYIAKNVQRELDDMRDPNDTNPRIEVFP